MVTTATPRGCWTGCAAQWTHGLSRGVSGPVGHRLGCLRLPGPAFAATRQPEMAVMNLNEPTEDGCALLTVSLEEVPVPVSLCLQSVSDVRGRDPPQIKLRFATVSTSLSLVTGPGRSPQDLGGNS